MILGDEDRLNNDQYFAFCAANPDLNVERTAEGEIVIVPPAGGDSDYRNAETVLSLGQWAKKDGSPDAAWISKERIALLSRNERRQFLRLVPEFVIEVRSASDRLAAVKKKMRQWMANGVEPGWLIDGDNKTVCVYRGTEEPRVVQNADSIAGEGPVEGFVLPLTEIREGLG